MPCLSDAIRIYIVVKPKRLSNVFDAHFTVSNISVPFQNNIHQKHVYLVLVSYTLYKSVWYAYHWFIGPAASASLFTGNAMR